VNRLFGLCLTVIACMLASAVCADERILNYASNVSIHANGELTVTETIRVRAEGNDIRRGIYRDFPTRYKDRLGNHYRVDFDVISVQRNGHPEAWHTEKKFNGIRVYAGSASRFLDHGEHEYEFRFRTNRQLGFFDNHDELWWEATGHGWMFPIDHAEATIDFPFDVAAGDLELEAYTGRFGSTDSDARSAVIDGHTVWFEATRPLGPREGLSVIAAWPKDLLAEPSLGQKALWFGRDNGAAIVLLLGILLPFAWYYWAWNKVGRDPEKGVIIPRFQPPTGLSPAACRYVLDMSFNRNSFTAAMISLAVKGHLVINEDDDDFSLTRVNPESPGRSEKRPTRGEQKALDALLPHSGSSIEMDNENHKEFQAARSALKRALKNEHLGRLFHLNGLYIAPAVAMTIVAAVTALAFPSSPAIWISYVALTMALHGAFTFLMRAPTPAGRLIMDEIEGFRMYLKTAEQDRLDRMRSPALTPELFEAFLPYAYALGVENRWCRRFANEVPEEIRRQSGYQPKWYRGDSRGMNTLHHLGDDFGSSFSSAISSASSPPGSSSGSGGGGFSGGGGGGGGGGGW
jgi:uncharacterized membrane protein YgcG